MHTAKSTKARRPLLAPALAAGDVDPKRFVSALAGDLGIEERKAVDMACAVVAGQARNRLLEVRSQG